MERAVTPSLRQQFSIGLTVVVLAAACVERPPTAWGGFNPATDAPPRPGEAIAGVPVDHADYEHVVALGERFFRYGDFGTERAITDVTGVMLGTVQVPCASGALNCTTDEPVLKYYVQALDALDGTPGNLFTGNGGKDGAGFTNDLVIKFPKGTLLYGGVAVPEEVHTGLDVDAGDSWPVGLDAVPVPAADQASTYLPNPPELGAGPAPEGRVRFRLSCAMCHYSHDIDGDGVADLHSLKSDEPTAGSPWKPADGWGVGNQDLAVGWVVALSANPLLLAPVFSGPRDPSSEEASHTWLDWVTRSYVTDKDTVLRDVVVGMITQPRGYADVIPDAKYNTQQLPNLYTWHNWPSNLDGAFPEATDRNNVVWTGTLDFTGLIGTCKQRAGSVALPWEPPSILGSVECDTLLDMMTRYSPVLTAYPDRKAAVEADILGTSDGVPGMINPDDVFVVKGSPALPDAVYDHPDNVSHHRQRTAEDFGPTFKDRGSEIAILGYRIRTPQYLRAPLGLDALVKKYPALDEEDLYSQAVNTWLDWMRPPANATPLLASAADQVEEGRKVFVAAGCDDCHRGPFGTDNILHSVSLDPAEQYGLPRAPSSTGWRVLDRGRAPAIGTDQQRTHDSRTLRRLVSPSYDPATGLADGAGGPLPGLLGVRTVGYKPSILQNLWNSAPYLHEGSIGIAFTDGSSAPASLSARLAKAGSAEVIYGMGKVLAVREKDPTHGPRADAALSLQALVLQSERAKVIAANEGPDYPVYAGGTWSPDGAAQPASMSLAAMGAPGTGHAWYIDDQPGGPKVTALVAYLLSLDDCPRDLPGKTPRPCEAY